MSIRKAQSEFVKEIKLKNENVDVIGNYVTARTPLRLFCRKHNYSFELLPDSALRSKYVCKVCSHEHTISSIKKSNESFLIELNKKLPTVIPIDKYKTSRDKITVSCKICGNIWESTTDSLLRGNGCKKCAMLFVQRNNTKTNSQFLFEIKKYNPNASKIKVISEYEKGYLPVICECLDCHRTWSVMASNLVDKRGGTACPHCNLSKGEAKIRNFLETNNILYESQKEFPNLIGIGGGLLRYDFYIPKHNLLIEYQGEFHDGSVKYQTPSQLDYQQEHDKRKRDYAKHNNIEILEIWYKDFNNIELILQNRLLN